MKPFRERNPVPIGATGIVVMVVLVYTAFHAQDLTIFGGGGKKYVADFSDGGDIVKNDEVRVAGVKVGTVTGVDLVGDHVQVRFRLKPGTTVGDQSRAAIKLRTIVGQRYLEIDPAGSGTLPAGGEIPLSRTSAPFSVEDAIGGLAQHADAIDTDALAKSFETLSSDFKDTPAVNRQALVGLSRLSHTISSRDAALGSQLTHAQAVTGTLNSRDAQLTALINDSDLVLKVLQQRRDVIDALLVHTSELADQLTGLSREEQVQLGPALAHVHGVLTTLQANRDNLDRSIQLLAPFARDFSQTLGNGRWFDTYVSGLPPNADPYTLINGIVQAVTGIVPPPGAASGHAKTAFRAGHK